jgi:hypothetical protein
MKGAYKNMKFNQKQNEALEEIYRVARIYTKIAAGLNEMAGEIKMTDGNPDSVVFTEEYVTMLVARNVRFMDDKIQLYAKDLSKETNDRLNDVKKAFQKTES